MNMNQICLFISLLLCGFATNAQNKNSIIAALKTMGNSNFIAQSYTQSLLKTKSLITTQLLKNEVVQIIFFENGFKENDIEVDGQTLNEGGYGFTIFMKPGIKQGTYKTNATNFNNKAVTTIDIGFSVIKKDTLLVLYNYSKAKKLLSTTNYVKSNVANTTGLESGYLHYQVNKIILSGKWTSEQLTVSFTNDGNVFGLADAVKYEVDLFTIRPKMLGNEKYDVITFTNNEGSKTYYLWQIKANKLMLYEQLNKGNYVYQPGKLKCTFTIKK